MTPPTTTYTPLTDAELDELRNMLAPFSKMNYERRLGLAIHAAAEIRALRAENAELFARNSEKMQALSVAEANEATLRAERDDLLVFARALVDGPLSADDEMHLRDCARAALARAEGRAEG